MKTLLKIIKITISVALIVHFINAIFFNNLFLKGLLNVKGFSEGLLYSFLISLVSVYYFKWVNQKVNWNNQRIINLIMVQIGAVLIVMPTYFLGRLIHLVIIKDKYNISDFVATEKIKYYAFPFIFSIAVIFFFLIIGFYEELQKRKINEQKIIAETAVAKFTVLKNQLDPHFLFNSLNVLTSLIEENPINAQKFTTSLSKTYRYVLEQKNKDLVHIEEEFRFAKTYMWLLQMRFENSISLELPEKLQNIEGKIIPLSLQLLLENAVKHNITQEDKPLKIRVYKEDDFLCVVNNLQLKNNIKPQSGIGLVNIGKRYEILTNRRFSVEKTDNEFIAKLPILAV